MSEDITQESRRRLLVLFKNHSEMADAYIAQFGMEINMKNIQSVRAQFPGIGDTGAQPAIEEEPAVEGHKNPMDITFNFNNKAFEVPALDPTKESPLYPRVVDCPICKKWGLNSQELRAKALSTMNDPFMAPVYISPGTFQNINYLLACVTVCEGCMLASPDRKDFVLYNRTTRQNQDSQLAPQVIRELKETTDKRKAFFEKTGIGDALFKLPRSNAAAIVSYQFADIRAEIESGAKVQGAYYKRGNYWTRIALLCRQAGMDDRKPLEIAAEHFKTAFTLSDFPKAELEFQTLYILFNLFLYFEKPKEAREYLSVIDKTRQDLEKKDIVPDGILPAAKKWLEMGKTRWDDRDEPNFWKTPGL
ncbi:MAG: DUF2225 domain-containing protein [Fibromonadaceae bacterium]|jgi:uncharacterized protein (DUF2225 family)|nr:DUF2225 domain-containing protein [Fibromonadaceae bacterium]